MKTENVPIASLRTDPRNARLHDQANLDAIAQSLREFGQQKPIVVGKDGQVVAGNGTLEAARALGWDRIDVVRTSLTPAQARAYAIADNRTAELADWDEEELAKLLLEIEQDETVSILATGFTPEEIRALTEPAAADLIQDMAPEPPKDTVTKSGDVWELGRHRLVCGNGTDAVAFAGLTASLCLTDPPYSVNYDRSQEERGGSVSAHAPYTEGRSGPDEILRFLGVVPCDLLIMTYPVDRHFAALSSAFSAHHWRMRRELVWVKDAFSFWPGSVYQQRHEPILIATRGDATVRGSVPANASTVIEHERPRAHDLHPTEKPIAIWAQLLGNHSSEGDIAVDPFLGSGTTLIACEQLNRTCFGVEIEPAYCDVVVERWQNLTGQKATRKTRGSG